ncbi:ribose-5-phosphate isomerase A [Hymenobacter qilianensis]|uniref:Ribose-5-phosphate isomerase A n=2 Tax=Hymenobacter qilianensis TaxID=1385715 RepID=A0ACB5PS44_9BACT|nr:ribose-5-phosphate isomerase RpiA [Hymenobacter qilianensis]QNP52354.1 ribose-5-phosphate isomerase RpiA [Hymenobacter qilianensis]GGF66832.1 ribose-5-phosphate isomerase A [Hymenobacter qilianensis]
MAASLNQAQTDKEKQRAAAQALRWVSDGMLVGLGSGSTAAYFIQLLGDALRAGQLRVQATATSLASEALARSVGIALVEPRRGLRFDLTVDGADEIAPQLALVKGGGGALLREKVLATASDYLLIITDSSKLVPQLGRFPLPLEVVPFALPWVLDAVAQLGGAPTVRIDQKNAPQPALSDQGNLLVDCHFNSIPDPAGLAVQLQAIPGIVEHGLFLGLARAAIVAQGEELLVLRPDVEPTDAADFTKLP